MNIINESHKTAIQKILIIYSSKYGCAEECANYLKSGLSDSVTLADIDKSNPNTILLEQYDTIIFGSSIYVGSISRKMRLLCKEKIHLLLHKKVGIYLCCAFHDHAKEYLEANFPSELLEYAAVIKNFGGEARVDKMKYLDRLIMKAAMKGSYESMRISQNNMDSFIKELTVPD